jgi:glycosyltransferase involved in cell wall biosynthesis
VEEYGHHRTKVEDGFEKMMQKANVSVFIMTLNEERNLPACVQALSWADEIFVLDSESTDRTRDIAEQLDCKVFIRKLVSWAEHQTWAIRNLPFRNSWVLNIDADEIVPDDLAAEIRDAVSSDGNHVAYRFRRKDYFLGTWLKRASFYPLWIIRLYRPERVKFERLVNPVTLIDGSIGQLQAHLIHFPFSKGVSHWFERHNSYSSLEALQILGGEPFRFAQLLSFDVSVRRRTTKAMFLRVPCRPIVKFLYLYFAKGGFLDGRAGLYYAAMQGTYEFMICAKMLERQAKERVQEPTMAATTASK